MAPIFLGFVPAIALVVGLANRTDVPVVAPVQEILPGALDPGWTNYVDLRAIWQGLDWQIGQIDYDGKNTLVVSHPNRRPWADLLLYWVPERSEFRPTPEPVNLDGHPVGGRQLPPEALFLGPMDGHITSRFEIPAPATAQPGMLTIYSLPYRRVAAVSEILTLR
jgi:hypothetical protein